MGAPGSSREDLELIIKFYIPDSLCRHEVLTAKAPLLTHCRAPRLPHPLPVQAVSCWAYRPQQKGHAGGSVQDLTLCEW